MFEVVMCMHYHIYRYWEQINCKSKTLMTIVRRITTEKNEWRLRNESYPKSPRPLHVLGVRDRLNSLSPLKILRDSGFWNGKQVRVVYLHTWAVCIMGDLNVQL